MQDWLIDLVASAVALGLIVAGVRWIQRDMLRRKLEAKWVVENIEWRQRVIELQGRENIRQTMSWYRSLDPEYQKLVVQAFDQASESRKGAPNVKNKDLKSRSNEP